MTEAIDWQHATFIGATLASGQTAAAAEAKVGTLRYDPMAMLPFIGYNVGDYLQHWLDIGKKGGDKLPKVFLVNWFRRGDDGRFLWPGFGENSRVLKWIVDRIEGRVDAKKTVVGYTAYSKDIDIEGLDTDPKDVKAALTAPADKWQMDLSDTEDWLKSLGPKVPQEIWDEFDFLKTRIKTANKDGNKALDDMKTK